MVVKLWLDTESEGLSRGGAGISKVVRPLHIKDDSCMCKEGGRSTTGNVQMI